jgi:hypothetical protein
MTLEDAHGVVDKLSKEQVQQVVNQFEAKYTEFNENDLGNDAYNYLGNAEVVLTDVARKLNPKECNDA